MVGFLMFFSLHKTACIALTALLLAWLTLPDASFAASHQKNIWNYDGGFFFIGDGGIPDGPCFRISGRVTAPIFFDNLKRIDYDNADSVFRRGQDIVTQFPEELLVEFVLYDFPCSIKLEQTGSPVYLTRELVASLHLNLYWKRGVELRPVSQVTPIHFSVKRIMPYNSEAHDLPEKLEWSYVYKIPSDGVPLTDNLVLIVRLPDGHIAARFAAHM